MLRSLGTAGIGSEQPKGHNRKIKTLFFLPSAQVDISNYTNLSPA